MKIYLMISKVLSSKRQRIKSILSFIGVFIIIFFVLISFTNIYSNYICNVVPFKDAKYDVELQETTQKDIEELYTMSNVEKYVTINTAFIEPQFRCGDKTHFDHGGTQTVVSTHNKLSDVAELIMSGDMIDWDMEILERDDAIMLKDTVAYGIGADVGDTVYLKCWTSISETEREGYFHYNFDTDKEYAFVVGAIYRKPIVVMSDGAIIQNSAKRKIILENYSERFKYGHDEKLVHSFCDWAFIKFKDEVKGLQETKNHIPSYKRAYYDYGDEWKEHINPDEYDYESYEDYAENYIEQVNSGRWTPLYKTRKFQLAEVERDTVQNTKTILFYTVLVTAVVPLIYIGKNYKRLKMVRKSIGILVSGGMSSRRVFEYITVTTFLEQIFMFLIVYLMQFIVVLLEPMGGAESISWYVVRSAYLPILIAVIISSVITGLFAAYMVSKKKLLEALTAET